MSLKEITLKLDEDELEVLMKMVDGPLRDTQGDGTLPDHLDDALVTLNDQIETVVQEAMK